MCVLALKEPDCVVTGCLDHIVRVWYVGQTPELQLAANLYRIPNLSCIAMSGLDSATIHNNDTFVPAGMAQRGRACKN
jgi:hypothetical protein